MSSSFSSGDTCGPEQSLKYLKPGGGAGAGGAVGSGPAHEIGAHLVDADTPVFARVSPRFQGLAIRAGHPG